MTVEAVFRAIDAFAPFSESMDFDNTGLLVGDKNRSVTKALICLDVTDAVLEEAKARGAELIISHHPVIFQPLRALESESVVYRAVRDGIAVISAHTNLDKAYPGGVNDALLRALGATDIRGLLPDGAGFIGYVGQLPAPMTSDALATHIKAALGAPMVRYTKGAGEICTLAVVGGAGGEYFEAARDAGADAFLTGEVKHHEAIAAKALGFSLFEAGHYHTEIVVKPLLCETLRAACPDIEFMCAETETAPQSVL